MRLPTLPSNIMHAPVNRTELLLEYPLYVLQMQLHAGCAPNDRTVLLGSKVALSDSSPLVMPCNSFLYVQYSHIFPDLSCYCTGTRLCISMLANTPLPGLCKRSLPQNTGSLCTFTSSAQGPCMRTGAKKRPRGKGESRAFSLCNRSK